MSSNSPLGGDLPIRWRPPSGESEMPGHAGRADDQIGPTATGRPPPDEVRCSHGGTRRIVSLPQTGLSIRKIIESRSARRAGTGTGPRHPSIGPSSTQRAALGRAAPPHKDEGAVDITKLRVMDCSLLGVAERVRGRGMISETPHAARSLVLCQQQR